MYLNTLVLLKVNLWIFMEFLIYFSFCCSFVLEPIVVNGCIFKQFTNYRSEMRELDGSLRCYQCASRSTNDLDVCNLNLWKHTNGTEKRKMITQCPKALSAFCHLVVVSGGDRALRGCSGPRYISKQLAHEGCFTMDKRNRVCLCNTNLCNTTNKVVSLKSKIILFVLVCIFM